MYSPSNLDTIESKPSKIIGGVGEDHVSVRLREHSFQPVKDDRPVQITTEFMCNRQVNCVRSPFRPPCERDADKVTGSSEIARALLLDAWIKRLRIDGNLAFIAQVG